MAYSIGVWQPDLTDDDIEVAKTLRKKPPKPKPTKVNVHETVVYNGIGVIGRLLSNDGLLGDEIEPGVWTIRDPLDAQHTKGEAFDGSTLYYAPTSIGHYLGTIYCLHTSHGHQNKSSQDWLRCWSQPQIDSAREAEGLPVWHQPKPMRKTEGAAPPIDFDELQDDANGPDGIACKPKVVIGVDIERMVDVCVPVLAKLNIYQADNRLVRLMNVSAEEADHRKVRNYAGSPVMRPAEGAHIKAVLSSHIEWVKERKGRKGEPTECPAKPDTDAVAALLERGTYNGIKHLIGLKAAPFFRPDGSVCTTPGYDESTAMYLSLAEQCPDIPNSPSLKDARAAIAELTEVFADFPHASPADKLVPIAAVLTILARPAIEGPVPGFAFDANRPRTGKGLQSNAVAMIATGREWSSSSWTSDDIETRKILDGWALDGAELGGFDDVNASDDFNCAALRSYLTQTSIQVRRLGYSGNVNCNWRGVILATGNKMRIRKDMRGRLLRSGLESQEPHPEQRKDFRHSPLMPWVKENQPRLLRAALVALRAWFANGRPQLIDETLGSFESWAQIIPQVIGWTTGENIFQCVPSIGEESEEDTFLARLVEALRARGERTAAALFDDSGFCELVREVRHGKTFTAGDVGLTLRGFKHQAVDLEDGRFWIDAGSPSKTGGVKWRVTKLADHQHSDHAAEGGDGGSLPLRARDYQVSNFIEESGRYPQPPPTFDEPELFSAEELASL